MSHIIASVEETQQQQHEEVKEELKGSQQPQQRTLKDLNELPTLLEQFLLWPVAQARVLTLIAEGGLGKTTALHQLALQHRHALPIRLMLPPQAWRRSALRGIIDRTLQQGYGLSADVVTGMKKQPQVFLVDALDELVKDDSWSADDLKTDLPELMGRNGLGLR